MKLKKLIKNGDIVEMMDGTRYIVFKRDGGKILRKVIVDEKYKFYDKNIYPYKFCYGYMYVDCVSLEEVKKITRARELFQIGEGRKSDKVIYERAQECQD